jgi:hypothetical protein
MEKNYKPVADYYKTKGYIIPSGNKNTILLKELEKDISKLQGDVNQLKKDISFIKDYIITKKEREDNRWF